MKTNIKKDIVKATKLGHNTIIIFNELANCLVIMSLNKPRLKNSPRLVLNEDAPDEWFDNGITLSSIRPSYEIYGTVVGSWRG